MSRELQDKCYNKSITISIRCRSESFFLYAHIFIKEFSEIYNYYSDKTTHKYERYYVSMNLIKKCVLVVIISCMLLSNKRKKKRYKSQTRDKYTNVLEAYLISDNKKVKEQKEVL